MTHSITELAKKCGDFFKKLSDYCYEYPKNNSNVSSKLQKALQSNHKSNKSKKAPKQKVGKNIKKLVDPNLPKKPLTPYITYFQEHKQRFQQIYPDLNLSDITKLIAKQWKQRSDEQKKPYLQKAENDRKRYETQLGAYQQNKKNRKTVIQISEKDEESEQDNDQEQEEENNNQ